MISYHPITVDVDFGHLNKMVSDGILHCKTILSPLFVISKYFG